MAFFCLMSHLPFYNRQNIIILSHFHIGKIDGMYLCRVWHVLADCLTFDVKLWCFQLIKMCMLCDLIYNMTAIIWRNFFNMFDFKMKISNKRTKRSNWKIKMPSYLFIVEIRWLSGPRLNIKTVFPRYGDYHVKNKTVVRPSYLNHGDPNTVKTSLYIEMAPRSSYIYILWCPPLVRYYLHIDQPSAFSSELNKALMHALYWYSFKK